MNADLLSSKRDMRWSKDDIWWFPYCSERMQASADKMFDFGVQRSPVNCRMLASARQMLTSVKEMFTSESQMSASDVKMSASGIYMSPPELYKIKKD